MLWVSLSMKCKEIASCLKVIQKSLMSLVKVFSGFYFKEIHQWIFIDQVDAFIEGKSFFEVKWLNLKVFTVLLLQSEDTKMKFGDLSAQKWQLRSLPPLHFSKMGGEAICSNIFWSMRRMTTRVGALKNPDSGGPSRYAEHVVLTYRKFFTRLWSWRVQPKNEDNPRQEWVEV